jgi:hypothetical protein
MTVTMYFLRLVFDEPEKLSESVTSDEKSRCVCCVAAAVVSGRRGGAVA